MKELDERNPMVPMSLSCVPRLMSSALRFSCIVKCRDDVCSTMFGPLTVKPIMIEKIRLQIWNPGEKSFNLRYQMRKSINICLIRMPKCSGWKKGNLQGKHFLQKISSAEVSNSFNWCSLRDISLRGGLVMQVEVSVDNPSYCTQVMSNFSKSQN